jgi:hypothetical protein
MTDWDSREIEGREEAFVISEDGHPFVEGDIVYNYYDMWPGTIHFDQAAEEELTHPEVTRRKRKRDVWFYVKPLESLEGMSSRQPALLNGERICSLEFAQRRGFRHAS